MRAHGPAPGDGAPTVIVLHGGPGAPGHVAPLARELAGGFAVLEPFQRRSGGEPLTVARHVADLRALIDARCAGTRPALVGSSWGAMLALACAAAHPDRVGPLVLIGCGTFDTRARARMTALLEQRTDRTLRERLAHLSEEVPDADARLALRGRLLLPLYCVDPVTRDLEVEACDARGNRETWADALRLQTRGEHPEAFAAITSPVLMLHGAYDPHPGPMIREGLRPQIPHLEYREWERCGHYPWLERDVREPFLDALRTWLARELAATPPPEGR